MDRPTLPEHRYAWADSSVSNPASGELTPATAVAVNTERDGVRYPSTDVPHAVVSCSNRTDWVGIRVPHTPTRQGMVQLTVTYRLGEGTSDYVDPGGPGKGGVSHSASVSVQAGTVSATLASERAADFGFPTGPGTFTRTLDVPVEENSTSISVSLLAFASTKLLEYSGDSATRVSRVSLPFELISLSTG